MRKTEHQIEVEPEPGPSETQHMIAISESLRQEIEELKRENESLKETLSRVKEVLSRMGIKTVSIEVKHPGLENPGCP